MSITELLPTLKELNHTDKLRVMQFLVCELARNEDALLQSQAEYPIWSPYDSFEAANVLLDALRADCADQHA